MSGFDQGWSEFAPAAGEILVKALSEAAPVGDPDKDPDSGTLAGSMEWQVTPDGVLRLVSMDHRGPIARYVVRGTRAHSIDPVQAQFLHWLGDFGDVYAKHVDHPGTQPNEFHIAAWERQKDTILALYRDRVGHGSLALLNPWRRRTLHL